MTLVVYSSRFDASPEELFSFYMDPANLPRISPPFPPFRLATSPRRSEVGDTQVFRLGFGAFSIDWHAKIARIVEGRLIEDVQDRGPFRRWRHQHRIQPAETGTVNARAVLTDAVSFRLIPTRAGEFLEFFLVRPAVIAMFAFRHWKTRRVLAHHK